MNPNDIPEIQRESFDNADVAFALGIHDFPTFRKNLERAGLFNVPRIDENPVRPRFRLGHIYDYALMNEFTNFMSREMAAMVVRRFFQEMQHNACTRFNALESSTREAIHADDSVGRYLAAYNAGQPSAKAPADNGWFADYPWLAFDPDVLDRSDERRQAPILWAVPSGVAARNVRAILAGPGVDMIALCDDFTAKERTISMDPDMVEPVKSICIVNVTALLAEVDRRLEIRLHARKLKGS